MGLEFIFSPVAILIFAVIVTGLVLLQRFVFRRAFEILGSKAVMAAYAIVLALSLGVGVFLGGGSLRESATYGLLAAYISLVFVTLGMLPFSLLLAMRGKTSTAAVIGAGVLLSTIIEVGIVLGSGLDYVVERGIGWLQMQATVLGFLVSISIAFSVGLRVR